MSSSGGYTGVDKEGLTHNIKQVHNDDNYCAN